MFTVDVKQQCNNNNKSFHSYIEFAGLQLKVIATCSVGIDHIDLVECSRRGIKVGHTPNLAKDTVAEATNRRPKLKIKGWLPLTLSIYYMCLFISQLYKNYRLTAESHRNLFCGNRPYRLGGMFQTWYQGRAHTKLGDKHGCRGNDWPDNSSLQKVQIWFVSYPL